MYLSNHIKHESERGSIHDSFVISFDSTSIVVAATVAADGAVAIATIADVVEVFCRTRALMRDPTRNANTELTNVMILNGIEPSGMGTLSSTGSLTRNSGVSVICRLSVRHR